MKVDLLVYRSAMYPQGRTSKLWPGRQARFSKAKALRSLGGSRAIREPEVLQSSTVFNRSLCP